MTNEELKEIEARAEAATPGPWEADTAEPADCVVWHGSSRFLGNVDSDKTPLISKESVCFDFNVANTKFIASARTDIPALVAEVRRLRSIVNEAANILYEAPEFNTTDSRVEDLLLAIREAYFILTSQGDRA